MATLQTPNLKLPYPDLDEVPDGASQIGALALALDGGTPGSQGVFFLGEVRFIAIPAPPPGWLVPDGRAISRTAYAKLFAAIGTTYGVGDGSTTFNLPAVLGRAIVPAGAGAGLTARAPGAKWGAESVALSTAHMPSHSHGALSGSMNRSNPHFHYISAYPDATGGILAVTNLANASAPNAAATQSTDINHEHAIGPEGGNQAHDNTQPSIAIPAYIYAGA